MITKETERLLDVSRAAAEVRDYDIDVDNRGAIETQLRKLHPKVGKKFIDEVVVAAQRQRDVERSDSALERMVKKVGNQNRGGDLMEKKSLDWIAEEVGDIIKGFRDHPQPRTATLLLIEQAGWYDCQKWLKDTPADVDELMAKGG